MTLSDLFNAAAAAYARGDADEGDRLSDELESASNAALSEHIANGGSISIPVLPIVEA